MSGGEDLRADKLQRINGILMDRIERLEASRGSSWSMFQAAVALEREVHARTLELEQALADLSQRNRELALARSAAEEANRSKTRFLRAAGHDLLQPIAAAKLFLDALGDRPMDATGAELVERLAGAFQSVEELMEAVLEISRLDSARIAFSRQPVALQALFARLAREYAPQAAAKGLRLVFAPTSAVVDSDPTVLRRITQNLISNAVKYTRAGGVVVGARRRRGRVWLEVRDSGIGIDAADRMRIFDEFQRVGSEAETPGMGLGLAIVRRACAKLDHPIQLESRPGRGTVFRVGLPAAMETGRSGSAGDTPPGPAGPPDDAAHDDTGDHTRPLAGLEGLTVLLVENDPVLRRAYGLLLRDGAGMTVHAAASTAAAEALLDEHPAMKPDLILADYHLGRGEAGGVAGGGVVQGSRADWRAASGGLAPRAVTDRGATDGGDLGLRHTCPSGYALAMEGDATLVAGEGDNGLVAIAALRARLGPVPALMVTAHGTAAVARACADRDVPLLLKPVTGAALRRAIEAAISAQR